MKNAENLHFKKKKKKLQITFFFKPQVRSGETAANIARELAEQTKSLIHAGDILFSVKLMEQLVDLLNRQLRNLTPGGKDSAARSLNKVRNPSTHRAQTPFPTSFLHIPINVDETVGTWGG